MTGTQIELAGVAGQMERRQSGPMELLHIAIQNNSAIDVIERLAALQEKAMDRDAELQFNEAMNACQSELGRIGTDMENESTRSRYASYAKLDRAIRPIYTKHGLSLSFSEEESSKADHARIICYVSKGTHTRIYRKDMPIVTTGPQGKAVMTLTHATGSADAYGRRYLLKDIFNIAIGEDDNDGNGRPRMEDVEEKVEWIQNARNYDEMDRLFKPAYAKAFELKDQGAIERLQAARKAKTAQFNGSRGAR